LRLEINTTGEKRKLLNTNKVRNTSQSPQNDESSVPYLPFNPPDQNDSRSNVVFLRAGKKESDGSLRSPISGTGPPGAGLSTNDNSLTENFLTPNLVMPSSNTSIKRPSGIGSGVHQGKTTLGRRMEDQGYLQTIESEEVPPTDGNGNSEFIN